MDNPDFAAFGTGFGIRSCEMFSLADLSVASNIVAGPREPVLLHVAIDGEPRNRWHGQFASNAAKVRGWSGGQ